MSVRKKSAKPCRPKVQVARLAARTGDDGASATVHQAIDEFTAVSLARHLDEDDYQSERREVRAGEALSKAIRQAAGVEEFWAWAEYVDERPGGRAWLVLPPGIVTRPDPSEYCGCNLPSLHLEMAAEGRSWTSVVVNILAYEPGNRPVIDVRQLDIDGDPARFSVGPGGLARLV